MFVSGRVCVQMQTCVTNSFSGAADNVRRGRLWNWGERCVRVEGRVCVSLSVYIC